MAEIDWENKFDKEKHYLSVSNGNDKMLILEVFSFSERSVYLNSANASSMCPYSSFWWCWLKSSRMQSVGQSDRLVIVLHWDVLKDWWCSMDQGCFLRQLFSFWSWCNSSSWCACNSCSMNIDLHSSADGLSHHRDKREQPAPLHHWQRRWIGNLHSLLAVDWEYPARVYSCETSRSRH